MSVLFLKILLNLYFEYNNILNITIMKHTVVAILAAIIICSALPVLARDYVPERGDFTFRTQVKVSCDEDDDQWCHADSILLFITDGRGRTEVRSVWAEPLDTVNWQGFGNVLEEDINFDGYPDLMVCNGPVNMFGNFTYTAFLWDQSSHSFLKEDVKGFDEINDPEINAAEKRIVGVWRLDNDVDITTYEWRDGKLVLVKSEHVKYNELAE